MHGVEVFGRAADVFCGADDIDPGKNVLAMYTAKRIARTQSTTKPTNLTSTFFKLSPFHRN